jgi:hypothetical protein
MTAAHDYEELHDLVDRLSPGQARRLLSLAKADPALADAEATRRPALREDGLVAGTGPDGDAPQRFQSFVGIMDSGRSDLSERHEEIIRDGLNIPA